MSAAVSSVSTDRDVVDQLREARDLIVQLQRELERAREVIDQQRAVVWRAARLQQSKKERTT
ncbi:MAG: hypothetical protein ABI461_23020 [Polyangiaceae bacterium]